MKELVDQIDFNFKGSEMPTIGGVNWSVGVWVTGKP